MNYSSLISSMLPDLDADNKCTCPGSALHSSNSWGDCILFPADPADPDSLPRIHCFHASCESARAEFHAKLWRACGKLKSGSNPQAYTPPTRKPNQPPAAPKNTERPEINHALVAQAAACGHPLAGPAYLRSISPTPIPIDPTAWPKILLDNLYRKDERILVFSSFTSQGNFLYQVGKGLYVLSPTPGVKAIPADRWPRAGREGIWFLAAPVTGLWEATANHATPNRAKLSRRSGATCTRYPYLVVESDDIPQETWFKIITRLEMPIAAIYSSAGKSIHALVKINASSTAEFKTITASYKTALAILGADRAAMTPVRLTRLPGCARLGKTAKDGTYKAHPKPAPMQELYYLNPAPNSNPLMTRIPRDLEFATIHPQL